jgi:hypothetical protein
MGKYLFEEMGVSIEYTDEIMEGNQGELFDMVEEQLPVLEEQIIMAIRDQWENNKDKEDVE